MKQTTKRIQVRIRGHVHRKLKVLAARKGTSITALATDALTQLTAKPRPE